MQPRPPGREVTTLDDPAQVLGRVDIGEGDLGGRLVPDRVEDRLVAVATLARLVLFFVPLRGIDQAILRSDGFHRLPGGKVHDHACDTSCPDCLRSWDNRFRHSSLDWRLALEVADLALGRQLTMRRWRRLAQLAAEHFASAYGTTLERPTRATEVEGLWTVSSDRVSIVIGHPLWRRDRLHWSAAMAKAVDAMEKAGQTVLVTDAREARRRADRLYTLFVENLGL